MAHEPSVEFDGEPTSKFLEADRILDVAVNHPRRGFIGRRDDEAAAEIEQPPYETRRVVEMLDGLIGDDEVELLAEIERESVPWDEAHVPYMSPIPRERRIDVGGDALLDPVELDNDS